MIHKRYLYTAALLALATAMQAQDSYQAAELTHSDLNGTARYVGMGGALSALGGDISTMATNPAGTALLSRSDISFSFGGVIADEGAMGHDRSRLSVDNGGAVFSFNLADEGLKRVNFGVNYVKHRNFLSNVKTPVKLHPSVPMSQTFQIAGLANLAYDNNDWGLLPDLCAPSDDHDGILYEDAEGYYGEAAQSAYYSRATYGSTSQVDINMSFNSNDRLFFGLSVGIYDLKSTREAFYQEVGNDGNMYDISSWYNSNGTGVDIKLGMICRPIENSPFRFGLSFHTPIWYNMEDCNGASVYFNDYRLAEDSYDPYAYKFRTPWTFNFSLGHTVGTKLALGAEYEIKDYRSAKYSGTDWDASSYFQKVNEATSDIFKIQHIFRLGAEYKIIPEFSIRLGYNYLSSPYYSDSYRTLSYSGPYTETDYTNWGGINRLTFGLGYRYRGGYVDFAYQYQAQKGDFYAFDDEYLVPTSISNNRSQLLFTLGFRF